MKKAQVFLLALSLLAGFGCAKKVTAPLPGSINSFDSLSYQTLMDAQAAINAVKDDIADKKFTPTQAQKAVINQAIGGYDLAETAWHAYHSGATADTAGLTAAINQLIADIAALASQIQGAK